MVNIIRSVSVKKRSDFFYAIAFAVIPVRVHLLKLEV